VQRLHYGWVILTVGTLVVFGALGLARFGYTMLLPSMQSAPAQGGLGLTTTQAGYLATANLLGYLALAVVGGALASRYGPRVVIAVGMFLAGGGMLLTGTAANLGSALIWRAVTGVGSGASNVPVMALMPAWFSARRRGLAAGVAVAGSSIGLMVTGPLIPRILIAYESNGWRVSWYALGAIILVVGALSWLLLRNHPSEKGLAPVGSTEISKPQSQTLAPALRSGPIGSAGVSNLQWGLVYRSLTVWHLALVYAAFGFSYIIYMTFFTKYLSAEGSYTKEAAGNLFMMMGVVSTLCGVWGVVSDRIGRRWALVIVYLIHATAYALFATWRTPFGFTLSAALFGLVAWSVPAITSAACGDIVGPRLAPTALGFVTLFFGIGQALGPSVAGSMADSAHSFVPAFWLAAGVAAVGAAGAASLRPTLPRVPPVSPVPSEGAKGTGGL